MKRLWNIVWQTGILAAVFWGAEWLVHYTGLPVPGNVLGIVVLFTLLCTGLVKESWVADAADFLLRHLVFFFVPIAVGLMNWGGVFYEYGWTLLAAIVISTLVPLLLTGFATRLLQKGKPPCSR